MDTVFILFTLALVLSRLFESNSAQHTALFILAGQSNMAGRGGVTGGHWDGYIPPENAPDSSRIFRLNANLTWEVAMDPLHQDIDSNKTCGVGPGMTFANTIKTWLMSEIGLIQNIRGDLGLPCLPFIQVAIASGEQGDRANRTLVEQIRNIQKSIHLPNVVTVDAKGLSLNNDHVHLTTAAQVSLGHMLAEAYLENFLSKAAAAPKN